MIQKYGKAGIITRISRQFHPKRGWYHIGIPIDCKDIHEEEM